MRENAGNCSSLHRQLIRLPISHCTQTVELMKEFIDRIVIVTNITITDKYLKSSNAHIIYMYLLFIYVILYVSSISEETSESYTLRFFECSLWKRTQP